VYIVFNVVIVVIVRIFSNCMSFQMTSCDVVCIEYSLRPVYLLHFFFLTIFFIKGAFENFAVFSFLVIYSDVQRDIFVFVTVLLRLYVVFIGL